MRRRALVLPGVLAGIAVVAAAIALWPTSPAGGAALLAPHPQSIPVLSARRVPAALSRFVADTRLTSALSGLLAGYDRSCLVVDDGDRTLFQERPDTPLVPASNLKLLTASAVLARLGPDHRLRTSVRARVGPGGVVAGDLWLVGGGDPLLDTGDYVATFDPPLEPVTPMEELARRVRAAGVTVVQGRVLGDETRYDGQRYSPTWKPAYIADNEIGPESALTVNDGFSAFKPKVFPAAAPATNAAAVFTTVLRNQGVTVVGVPGQGAAPAGLPEVASMESAPLAAVVGEMLRDSDNMTAELLTKELGRAVAGQPTALAGVAAVRRWAVAAGLPVAGLAAVDGSGLDRSDRATCRLLLAGLALARRDHSPVLDGLAIANRSGTLLKRFAGNPAAGRLRAKTGSLDGVTALTGLVPTGAGVLTFSMVVNGLAHDRLGPLLWERLGAVLAAYPDAPSPAVLAPASPSSLPSR
jgi:serine-type D-Ala-D-Ala carboxypeptidase/endopeptidase (penicillin-binding protein 4)